MICRRTHTLAGAITAGYLIIATMYALRVPLLEVSDEVRHYALVEHLARGGGLPIQDPQQHARITAEERRAERPLTYYAQEGSQPPLYYALMALLLAPLDRSDYAQRVQPNPHAQLGRADATNNWNQLLHTPDEHPLRPGVSLAVTWLRLVSMGFGAVTVVSTFGFARELRTLLRLRRPFLGNALAPLAAVLVAFNPMFIHIMASVNNDTLAAALASLALWLGARAIRRGLTPWGAAQLGIVLGCAALSKASGLALAITVPVVVGVGCTLRPARVGWRASARQGIAFAIVIWLVAATVSGWWYLRNAWLYGEPTGTLMMARIAGARERLPSILELLGEWDGFFKAYWGLFGAVNIPMALPIYDALEALMALAGFGLIVLTSSWLRAFARHLRRPSPAAHPHTRSALLAASMGVAALALALAALARWTSLTLASQGRLLFPVITAISTFTALGLLGLAQHFAPRLALPAGITLGSGLATLALLALPAYILPAYRPPELLPNEHALPRDITRTELFFEDAIRWIGFRVNTPAQRIRPGEELDVTLYWQALRPMERNYSAFVRLFARHNTEVFVLDTYPGGGMFPTTLWQPGEIIADRYRLRVENAVTSTQHAPSVLRLDVGFWDFTTQRFLETRDGAGKPTGRQRYEAASLGAPCQAPAPPAVLRFAEADITSAFVKRPSPHHLTLVLDWLARADFQEDYTTFVQLFDASGNKLEPQADGRALGGDFAPRWWRAGDVISGDRYTLTLPNTLPSGRYWVKFGLYRSSDGARMAAFDARGELIPDAAHAIEVELP
ncbi:MAG: hypothetical protein ACK4WM_10100 [Thermoflexales bacterium]